jgi:hypothetical protein
MDYVSEIEKLKRWKKINCNRKKLTKAELNDIECYLRMLSIGDYVYAKFPKLKHNGKVEKDVFRRPVMIVWRGVLNVDLGNPTILWKDNSDLPLHEFLYTIFKQATERCIFEKEKYEFYDNVDTSLITYHDSLACLYEGECILDEEMRMKS